MNKEGNRRVTVLRVLSLVLVLVISVFLFVNRDELKDIQVYGYPGIVVLSFLANATLILPVPGILITSLMGTVFNPFWVGIAAGTGAALGEITGYMAGFSGQAVIENRKWYDRITLWMKKYGDITIFFLALIPNPFFDAGGIIAGALKMPLWRFLLWCWLGKVIKMIGFALAGAEVMRWISM
ncbi:MAG: VTT domain-containing protein [Anaerolineaceae bacterium]|nr:VTT domain-containing protein [Anaerolineaceae bacterium]